MVLGGTERLDRAHVDGSRNGSQRRKVVQSDRQGHLATQPEVRLYPGEAQRRERRSGPRDDQNVRGPSGGKPSAPVGVATSGQLPPAADPPGVDCKTREQRETPSGNPDGSRPGGTGRDP